MTRHKQPYCPGGWCGSVWYATSEDGRIWEEKGVAIDHGAKNVWDGNGAEWGRIMDLPDLKFNGRNRSTGFLFSEAGIVSVC